MENENKRSWEDPIVAEVRAIRDAYAKKFNYDLRAICDDLKQSETEYKKMGFKFVTRQPKMLASRTGTDS